MLSNTRTSIISRAQRHVVRCALHAALGGALRLNPHLAKSRETIRNLSTNFSRDPRIYSCAYCEQNCVYYGKHVLRIRRENNFPSFRSYLLSRSVYCDGSFIAFILQTKKGIDIPILKAQYTTYRIPTFRIRKPCSHFAHCART